MFFQPLTANCLTIRWHNKSSSRCSLWKRWKHGKIDILTLWIPNYSRFSWLNFQLMHWSINRLPPPCVLVWFTHQPVGGNSQTGRVIMWISLWVFRWLNKGRGGGCNSTLAGLDRLVWLHVKLLSPEICDGRFSEIQQKLLRAESRKSGNKVSVVVVQWS